MNTTTEQPLDVDVAEVSFPFGLWRGEKLKSPFAFDTETEVIDSPEAIPRLSLCTASDGETSVIFPPNQLSSFLWQHRHCEWVGHNFAFDFHVVLGELERRNLTRRCELWWGLVDGNRIIDTMLLDMLIRLARHDAYPAPRNLAVVASSYAEIKDVDKEDPWRMRYGELIGVPPSQWPIEAQQYAVKDAIVTAIVYGKMRDVTDDYTTRTDIPREMIEQWGPLTLGVQVKASIAFGGVERLGMAIDTERVECTRRGIRDRLESSIKAIGELAQSEGLFQRDKKTGEMKRTKTEAPSLSTEVLRSILTNIISEIEQDTGRELDIPRTATGLLSTSIPEWEDYVEHHPFLSQWKTMQELSKLLQFFTRLEDKNRVHPRYTVMVRTGRTSARNPNIQQIPRAEGIRELFVASPGHLLLQTDYSFIELRTLAAVCEDRYGYSELGNVIRAGIDPHVRTAAMINRMGDEDFIALKGTDPQRFKDDRQAAKACNFGIPSGLGPRNLAKYAHRTYGVEMSTERAGELREKIIGEVYPELTEYLSEDTWTIYARSIGCSRSELIKWICRDGVASQPIAGAVRKILVGNPFKTSGEPYNPEWVEQVWKVLNYLNTNPDLEQPLRERDAGVDLMRAITYSPVRTLTGRIRGRVSYSQARNTPFQGLASDGAKLAVYRLCREGHRVVGFVHDEVLIELPEAGKGRVSLDDVRNVERIMVEEMGKVCDLPIGVESALSGRWSKSAGMRIEGDYCYPSED